MGDKLELGCNKELVGWVTFFSIHNLTREEKSPEALKQEFSTFLKILKTIILPMILQLILQVEIFVF